MKKILFIVLAIVGLMASDSEIDVDVYECHSKILLNPYTNKSVKTPDKVVHIVVDKGDNAIVTGDGAFVLSKRVKNLLLFVNLVN